LKYETAFFFKSNTPISLYQKEKYGGFSRYKFEVYAWYE
jgi:hypothetical protein